MQQFELDFEGGLVERFTFEEMLRHSAHNCGRQFKAIAADMDMSPSELSRKLANNPNDPIFLPAIRLPDFIAATKDLSPVFWLVERFCDDPENKKRKNIERLAALLPEIERALKGVA